ncbi:DUF2934 domain-containing protein [Bosea rubneri]|uniref:DUF2934 domain-containing protein n=1 Tax=Bosea rubneri TaxID=3075434 RepID=A0ABU3S660_9HYPH|nr:DUF2934 domain-containing protein [Bosea sp. ZW T0_25]MDU0340206.1 DUF2934 domain-containing protein [Bosea sp. ZW T0_25]
MADVGNAQREIRRIAYRLWMEEGQPEGRDREHWERAKEIWNFRHRDDEAETSDRQMEASGSGYTAPSDATPRRRPQ